MKKLTILKICGLALFCSLFGVHAQDLKPIRILLVGDSTLATKNGYGDEFCKHFKAAVTCVNLAKNGRSSSSYRTEGSWDKVIELLKHSELYEVTYVLIEFGHNDQPGKPGRSTDLKTEFPANLTRYVSESMALSAKPILSTPLSRRSFINGQLVRDLDDWAAATKEVAQKTQTPLIDLLSISADAVQQMGSAEADTLAVEPPGKEKSQFDHTHVGLKGAKFFANLVTPLYKAALPNLTPYLID
jgi:lysophospholipase L1-like esterase